MLFAERHKIFTMKIKLSQLSLFILFTIVSIGCQTVKESTIDEVSEEDSLLRNRLAQESQYELNALSQRESGLKNLFLFKPLNGTLSGEFDSKIGHYGIDLIAPKNEIVKSVMDGTIILSNPFETKG